MQDLVLETLKTIVLTGWPEKRERCPIQVRDYWNYIEEISLHNADNVSDNGTPFSSQKFHEFLRSWKFNHVTSKANGKAESSVRTVKHLFKEAERDGKDPLLALLDYGNNHTEGLGTSPSQRLMSRRTRTLLPTAASLRTLLPTAASLPRPEIIPDSTEQLEGKGERPSFTMTVLQNSCLKLNSCKRIKRGNRLLA